MNTKKRKFEMNLLNAEEMKGLEGGAVPPNCSTGVVGFCKGQVGDVILDNCTMNDLILCATYEVRGATGTHDCGDKVFYFTCPSKNYEVCIKRNTIIGCAVNVVR